jgi:hypothetical protein
MWYRNDIRCIVETRNRNIVIYSYIGIVFIQFYVFVFNGQTYSQGSQRLLCGVRLPKGEQKISLAIYACHMRF